MGKQIYVRETVNEALPLLPMPKSDFAHRLIYNGELKMDYIVAL